MPFFHQKYAFSGFTCISTHDNSLDTANTLIMAVRSWKIKRLFGRMVDTICVNLQGFAHGHFVSNCAQKDCRAPAAVSNDSACGFDSLPER